MDYKNYIKHIRDFPCAGATYQDISPLIADPASFAGLSRDMLAAADQFTFDAVAAVDARGFIFGSIIAYHKQKGLVLIRKKGSYPAPIVEEIYAIDYGCDSLTLPAGIVEKGKSYLIVDDALASGKTAHATANLISKAGGTVSGFLFLIEIKKSLGSTLLGSFPYRAIITY